MNSLKLKLAQLLPTRVVVTLADGEHRELRPARGTRKRWQPILEPLAKMEWLRVELFDKDTTVAVIDNPDAAVVDDAPAAKGSTCPTCGRGDESKTIIAAQREALTWQDKSVRAALDTCVSVVDKLGDAVGTLHKTYQGALDVSKLQQQQPILIDDDDDIASMPMLRQLLPAIVQQLGGGGTGGVNVQLTDEQAQMLRSFLQVAPKAKANGNGANH